MKDQEIVPLRVVLRNFLNHIENLESQNCPEESYEAEFQDLKIFSENAKSLKEYSCLEGEKEVNRKKNRYKDILPFDVSRVVLNEYAGIPGSDYINANFIKGASGSLAYIASQGPLPSTVNDFWRMVVQCEVQVIVMACNEEEAGKAKCEKYWVDDGEEKQFGMISVKLLKSSTVCSDFSVRTMRLKYTTSDSILEERTVCQLHYVAWPDHGVPTVVQPLLDMVRLVRDTQASETLPVLVHCSAGCGRTGTICAIDYVWGLLRTGKLTRDFSLLSLIRDMRKQRIAMVQTKEQYVLVHQAVRELFKEQLSMIDSHPYENVDPDGLLIIKEEENTYDSIDYTPNKYQEEKGDNKEKDSAPPPLPLKRNISKFPSKYEKEIENLTAQQKALKANKNIVPIYSSNEKKKVNNKEYYNCFDKVSKRLGDNHTKLDGNKPIPSKGILCVPQLESAPKCKTNVKRSKSLKIVRNCEKSSLSFCQNSPTENKRRSSLESNFDEHIIDSDFNDKHKTTNEVDQIDDLKKKPVPQLVSKYDILKNQDHRTFVRSLTCMDLRPKMVFSHTNSVVSSLEDSLAKQRVKLLRSNTQINVLKKDSPYSQAKNKTTNVSERIAGLKIDSSHNNYSFICNNKLNFNSFEKVGGSNPKIGPKPLGKSSSTMQKHSVLKTSSKDFLPKSSERVNNPSFQNIESLRYLKDSTRHRSSSTNRSEQKKHLPYEESFEKFSGERNAKPNSKTDKFISSGLKIIHTNSPIENEEPKYISRTNQFKYLKSTKKSSANKSVAPLPKMNDFTNPIHGLSKDHFNRTFREDFSRVQHMDSGHEEFLTTNSHLKEEYPTITEMKASPSFNDCFTVDESNNSEPSTSSWLERDSSRIQTNYSKPMFNSNYVISRPKGQFLLVNTSDDSKEVQRRLDGDIVLLDSYEHSNSVNNTGYDSSYKECTPLQHNDVSYHLQNRKNIHQYNGSVHSSRHPPNIGPDIPSTSINRTSSKNSKNPPRIIDVPSGSQDISYYSSEIHRSYRDDCFHSAPGVDLDQVAASITKNDENLMKATLEELQVRKTRLLMTPKERCPPKGVPIAGGSSDKKRQQQYL